MKDYSELKMLAEKATPGLRVVTKEWSDDDFEYQQEIFSVWSECETLEINIDGSFVGKDKADAEFIAAANPAAVLELISEVEALKEQLECADEQVVFLEKQVKKLILENESLKKDAARYRWLRKKNWFDSDIAVVRSPNESVKLGYDCPSNERLDNYIDNEIKESKS